MLLIAALVAASASAAEPFTCPDADPPALAVVLWDRTDPSTTFLGLQIGTRLGEREVEMQQSLLDTLFGLDGVLVPGDRLSAFPNGIDAEDPGVDILRSTKGKPADMYTRLKIALPGPRDPVRPLHMVIPADGRGAVERAITASIVEPLLAPCEGCTRLAEHVGDPDTERGLAQPWLLTHHALAQAFVEQGLDKPCAEPDTVYLAWVSPSNVGAYDPERLEPDVRAAFGELAVRWLWALDQAYWLEPVRSDRHVKLFRVHRGAASPQRGGDRAITWLDEADKPATLVRGTTWRGGFDTMPPPQWTAPLLPNWTPHTGHADVTWRGSRGAVTTEAVPLGVDAHGLALLDPTGLRDALVAGVRGELDAQRATFDPDLRATVRLLPPADPLFGWSAVAILEERAVESPRIRLSYVPVPWWQLGGGFGAMGLGGLAVLQQARARLQRRRLAIDLGWDRDVELVDLLALRDQVAFEESFRVRLSDASGYRPRACSLEVRVSLRTFLQPEVPIRDDARDGFQSLAADRWDAGVDGLSTRVTSPHPDALLDRPVTIVTQHSAIDFGRVRKDELAVVHAIRVRVHDRTGRYVDVDETLFRPVRLRAVPGPAEPRAGLDISPAFLSRWLEVRLVGLTNDEWRGARRVDVGWLSIENPVRKQYTPLPVTFRLASARVTLTAEGTSITASGTLLLRDTTGERPMDQGVTLSAGERRSYVVTVELPDDLRDAAHPRWHATIDVAVGADDGSAQRPKLAPLRRTFRLRTAGRSRAMVLDFGTGATRLLLQDLDEERWGFLPLEGDGPDLGGAVFVAASGEVSFGASAELHPFDAPAGRFIPSLKALLLRDGAPEPRDLVVLGKVIDGLLARFYAPLQAADADVWGVRYGDRIALTPGPRGQLVVLVPNEAHPLWVAALRESLSNSNVWSGAVAVLCEAEAAALWYASVVYAAPPRALPEPPPRLRLLVLDVGAGTTDAALVEIDRTPERQSLALVGTGGAAVAGRTLDEAVFDAIAEVNGSSQCFAALPETSAHDLRAQLEHTKRRMSTPDRGGDTAVRIELPGGVVLSAPIASLSSTQAWRRAVDRVAREALTVLVGRLDVAREPLAGTHLVVLTGRGSQADSLVDAVERAVGDLGAEAGRVHRVDSRFLKESVSLGGRLYALGLCGDFLPAEQCFRDRLVLVYRRPFGRVHAKELLAPGRAYRGGAIQGDWTDVPTFEQARLVRTWMRPVDGDRSAPWEMDARSMVAILQGEPLEPFRGMPTAVPAWLPVKFPVERIRFDQGPVDDVHARVRVVVEPDGSVQMECA